LLRFPRNDIFGSVIARSGHATKQSRAAAPMASPKGVADVERGAGGGNRTGHHDQGSD
jgi:hypothetical protein